MIYPVVKEIAYTNPVTLFAGFAKQHAAVFLDSAAQRVGCSRYSFIAIDPFLELTCQQGRIQLGEQVFQGDPWEVLEAQLARFPLLTHENLPPFQGGVAGYFSYDLCQYLEKLPLPREDDLQCPDLAVGFYDVVIAFDHEWQRAWIFSSGYPIEEETARIKQAEARCEWMEAQLKNISVLPLCSPVQVVCAEENIISNFTAQAYQQAVETVIQYILAGDIFEANISQRFQTTLPPDLSAFELYLRLRARNPAPFSAYLSFHDLVIASASPERFLKLSSQQVETRPIKGTRHREKDAARDQQLATELLHNEKDRAENIMIVDLLRNDLSRVCEAGSVQVPQLCELESYATVHHLVSVVTGRLQKKYNAVDLLRATFPGGSITGAPKIRAMEIIAELEPTARGPYCGSIGYIGFQGDMDCSITIRTYVIKKNKVTFQVGGAVVMDSNPCAEYEETLVKAAALRDALLVGS